MDKELKLNPISDEVRREMKIAMMSARLSNEETLICGPKDLLVNETLMAYKKEQERRLEYAMRYLIPLPIKGEITRAKVRYRGLYLKENHSYSQHIQLQGDKPVLICTFLLPNLCGLESRSGKRKAFELSLAFQDETLRAYQKWCEKTAIVVIEHGRNYGRTLKRHQTKGIIEQIKKEDYESKTGKENMY